MSTANVFSPAKNVIESPAPLRRGFLSNALSNLSLGWKMGLMVLVLSLGILGIAISAYVGIRNLRYQLSNIYDFMLVPIVAINQADTALADTQLQLVQSYNENSTAIEQEQYLAAIEANNRSAQSVITRYDTEWVTTVSPEFTQSLRQAGKLDLQNQELIALTGVHASFEAYQKSIGRYLETVKAGRPDKTLAGEVIKNLRETRANLQNLIDINNQYADFSNNLAQAAYRQAIVTGTIVLSLNSIVGFFLSYLIVVSITSRLRELSHSATIMQQGNLDQVVNVIGRDEISVVGSTFNNMALQLKESFATLEQRVANRTRNLQLAAEVGRAVSQVRALDIMLKEACELILKEFNLYYAQVYLTDPSQTILKLEAGTGSVGIQLLGRGHSLPLDTGSINGRAAVERRSVVISDTTKSATFRQNPLLPDTRGEMAVPLIVADKVVGVLDMQSSSSGLLNEEVLPAFEALAGQLAVAVQNASLLAETEQARAQVETQARRLVRAGWNEHLDAIHKPEQLGFIFDHNQVSPITNVDESHLPDNEKSISVPIAVTGEALGSLVVEIDDEARREHINELVNVVAHQVAQQIENLRLLESAERYRNEAERAARLQTLEGWQEYINSRATDNLGYLYDLKEVRPFDNGQERAHALTFPVKARDQKVGKLSVDGLTAEDTEAVELANVVVERLGAHIESLRLFEETRRGQLELDKRAKQLAAVAEISTASSQELEVDKLLSTVVHLTQRQFNLYHTHIFTFNETTEELRIAACGWQEGDENEGTHESVSIPVDQEQSLVARAARTRQAVIINDVKNEPGWLANPQLPYTASEMAVPVVVGDRLLGVLDVQSDRLHAFTEEDANIQTTLASQVATAMQNARSFTQAQKQAEREATLNTISQKIQGATTVEAVLQIAARELGHALGAPLTVAQLGLRAKTNGNHNGNGS
jgi:GAF domain-containing protein/HAMP domain-containing protein